MIKVKRFLIEARQELSLEEFDSNVDFVKSLSVLPFSSNVIFNIGSVAMPID